MHSEEGVTIAKMAVTVLIVVLLIGAILSLWWVFMNSENKMVNDLEGTVTSGTRSRLYDLMDQSLTADSLADQVSGHPLVTTVANCLAEFDNLDLLYVYCTEHKLSATGAGTYSGCYLYTYPGANITNFSGLPHGTTPITQFNNSDVPVTQAVKNLLKYSQYRCHVTVADVPYGNSTLTGIVVEILVPES